MIERLRLRCGEKRGGEGRQVDADEYRIHKCFKHGSFPLFTFSIALGKVTCRNARCVPVLENGTLIGVVRVKVFAALNSRTPRVDTDRMHGRNISSSKPSF